MIRKIQLTLSPLQVILLIRIYATGAAMCGGDPITSLQLGMTLTDWYATLKEEGRISDDSEKNELREALAILTEQITPEEMDRYNSRRVDNPFYSGE